MEIFQRRHSAMAFCIWLAACGPAFAADMIFQMRNSHPNAVEVELYSQDRTYVWPGHGQVYLLDDGETRRIPVSCDEGERICYGAWLSGDTSIYWGTGPDNRKECNDCCYTCSGDSTEEIDLTK